MSWSLQNGNLVVNGQPIELPGPAREAIEVAGVVVVLLEFFPESDEVGDRNVLAIDLSNGQERWRIASETRSEGLNQATGIKLKEGKVWLHFREGVDGYIDLQSGRVTIPPGQRPW